MLAPVLSETLVALDFDGTLAPIVERPEDARAAPGAADVLTAISNRVARTAIITGRPAAEAVRLGGFSSVPGLIVCGHYGLERWSSGELESPPHAAAVAEARARVEDLLRPERADRWSGASIEDKGHSVAVHTRRAADPPAALVAIEPYVTEIARETGLELTPGRLVFELRPAGVDKGATLRELVTEMSPSAVVYAGDDIGDLPAVEAVSALRREGVTGMVICSEADAVVPELRDRADLVVRGPEGVLEALRQLLL
ncbi:trehalose-phosphatase [Actinobacteria bacterium YIM 96077]|uniref:Trehalose 6-phosphate phosphatase n=2 Tax=Phytoactinopolyspora halophila TaxID=1981511 RepID=A0A329R1C8_9ACTN|nr:trehalose-phosphatase [Actinobacteria bacterium YIM 96077]RAW18183.1 trehalose-phosphatase [Phytoactinopolyspora halophila]